MNKFNRNDEVHVTHKGEEYAGCVTQVDEDLPRYRVHLYYDEYIENTEFWFSESEIHRLSVKARLARIEKALGLLD